MLYGSGIKFICCISRLHPPTQTVDIKDGRGDVRFSVTQTSTFYNTALINKVSGAGSPQKYVNIFFRKGKYFICPCSFLMRRLQFGVKFTEQRWMTDILFDGFLWKPERPRQERGAGSLRGGCRSSESGLGCEIRFCWRDKITKKEGI